MFCFFELLLFFNIIYNSPVIDTKLIVEEGIYDNKDKPKTFAGKKNNNKTKHITVTKIERTESATRVTVVEGQWTSKTQNIWCCLIPYRSRKNNNTIDD